MKSKKEIKRVGKYQRFPKDTKKFLKGGETSDDDLSLDNLSFGQAFNAVREHLKSQGMDPNAEVFTWRGKKYSTAMAAPKPVTDPSAEPVNARAEQVFKNLGYKPESAATSQRAPDIGTIQPIKQDKIGAAVARGLGATRSALGPVGRALLGNAPEEVEMQSYGFSPFLDPSYTGVAGFGVQPSRAEGFLDTVLLGAGAGEQLGKLTGKGVRALGKAAIENEARSEGRRAAADMVRRSQELAAKRAEAVRKAAATRAAKKAAEEKARKDAEDEALYLGRGFYKRGGKVKKYASGGHVSSYKSGRGDGIASKGKTRGKSC